MFSFCCLVADSEKEDQTNVEDWKPEYLHVQMVCISNKYRKLIKITYVVDVLTIIWNEISDMCISLCF